jgi:uncharacterized protein YndB with AHSA1/START domain
MNKPSFVYVTFIRASADKVWDALTVPEFTAKTWFGMRHETDWKPGSPWRLLFPDGRVADAGEVIEIDRPRRLVLKWRNEFKPELKAEGYSRCTIEIESVADNAVKLTVVHQSEGEGPKFIEAVSGGWPRILSNVKSLLETGEPVLGNVGAR